MIYGLLPLYSAVEFFNKSVCVGMTGCTKSAVYPQVFAHFLVQLLVNNKEHINLPMKSIAF